MMPPENDKKLFALLSSSTHTIQGLLRALAQRGKWLQMTQLARAETLLANARPHPLYKGAKLAFDLLELEDLMLQDAPSTNEAFATTAKWLAKLLQSAQELAGERKDTPPDSAAVFERMLSEAPPENGWPAITSAEYLYDFVVLGVLSLLSRAMPTDEAEMVLATRE